MALADLPPALDWTLFAVVVIACFSLGIVYIARDGHVDLFGNIDGLDELLFALVLFAGIALVVAPFYGLWVAGRWVFHQFSPEARAAHAEAVAQRHGERKIRNPRLDQDRQARRLAASKHRAEKQAAANQSPAAHPSGSPVTRD